MWNLLSFGKCCIHCLRGAVSLWTPFSWLILITRPLPSISHLKFLTYTLTLGKILSSVVFTLYSPYGSKWSSLFMSKGMFCINSKFLQTPVYISRKILPCVVLTLRSIHYTGLSHIFHIVWTVCFVSIQHSYNHLYTR